MAWNVSIYGTDSDFFEVHIHVLSSRVIHLRLLPLRNFYTDSYKYSDWHFIEKVKALLIILEKFPSIFTNFVNA